MGVRGPGDAIRGEVGGTERLVVGHHEVPIPGAEIRDAQREARTQLVLERGRALPVVAAMSEARERIGAQPCLIGRQAELGVRERPAFSVRRGKHEIAVGNEVGVRIGPGAVGAVHLLIRRVPELREVRSDERHVSTERHLGRGLSVAEQVIRCTKPWTQVLVVRQVLRLRVRSRGHEDPGRSRLLRIPGVEVVEASAEIERDPLQRPLVLRIQPEVDHPVVVHGW